MPNLKFDVALGFGVETRNDISVHLYTLYVTLKQTICIKWEINF